MKTQILSTSAHCLLHKTPEISLLQWNQRCEHHPIWLYQAIFGIGICLVNNIAIFHFQELLSNMQCIMANNQWVTKLVIAYCITPWKVVIIRFPRKKESPYSYMFCLSCFSYWMSSFLQSHITFNSFCGSTWPRAPNKGIVDFSEQSYCHTTVGILGKVKFTNLDTVLKDILSFKMQKCDHIMP